MTNEEVIANSTRVAQEASRVAGLGDFVPGARIITEPKGFLNSSPATEKPIQLNQPPSPQNTDFNLQGLAERYNTNLTSPLRQNFVDAFNPSQTEQNLESQLTNLRGQIDKTRTAYKQGALNIENKPIAMEFITGEQAALKKQELLDVESLENTEKNLMLRLGLEQNKRATTKEMYEALAREEDRIFNRADKLNDNARQTLATILEKLQGLDMEDIDTATQIQIGQLASQAGIPLDVLIEGMKVVKSEIMFDRNIKSRTLAVSEGNLALSRARFNEDNPSPTPTPSNPNSTPNPGFNAGDDKKRDDEVKRIISLYPGEWGMAADAIDRKYGAGTATKYDALLKEKYADKKKSSSKMSEEEFLKTLQSINSPD